MSTPDAQIDALILAAAGPEWEKIALLISKVFDSPGFDKENVSAQQIAERLYILVDNGQLGAQGNMRRWRDGEVRAIG